MLPHLLREPKGQSFLSPKAGKGAVAVRSDLLDVPDHAIAACGKGYAKPGWIWLAVAPHARSRRGRRPFGVELLVHIRSIVEPGARFKRLLLPGWTGCAEHPASGQACSIPIAKPPRREGLRRPNFTDGPMIRLRRTSRSKISRADALVARRGLPRTRRSPCIKP